MPLKHFLIVGAGFSGATLARELVESCDCRVTILEERTHIAGNCHTARDPATGVMVHTYGPHIFNTNRDDVWQYVNRHVKFGLFVNRVKAVTNKGVFSLPVNLHTINQFFGKTFNPEEARRFIAGKSEPTIGEPRNFEEQALKFIGRELYETFFYGYTKKQWGCEPRELPAAILKRLPLRFNYNDNYYDSLHQGIPMEGYTEIVARILRHDRIEVILGTRFKRAEEKVFDHIFYTGPLDAFFNHECGRLGYRTVTFDRIDAVGDFQGNAILNYTGSEVSFTRIHEHKHFAPWETHHRTVAFKEFSKETAPGELPYYPKRLATDKKMLADYRAEAMKLDGVSFLGRLATYRYLNMDQVIGEALDFSKLFLQAQTTGRKPPVFSCDEPPYP